MLKEALGLFYLNLVPAKLHHNAWKCTVFYNETVECGHPHPARVTRARVEVVYLDKDYLVPAR